MNELKDNNEQYIIHRPINERIWVYFWEAEYIPHIISLKMDMYIKDVNKIIRQEILKRKPDPHHRLIERFIRRHWKARLSTLSLKNTL